jgi:hypothetical protein
LQRHRPTSGATGERPWASRLTVLAAYLVVTAVMTWPFVNYAAFSVSSYGGDARLIIWTTAWANHAVLNGLPLFDANIFFPAADSLRYNEHLLGVSLATLPWAVLGASPVLAYNATWLLAFVLNGVSTFACLRQLVESRVAAFAGSLAFVYTSYVWLHAHGHLHLIWIWPLPLSALLLERWFVGPTVGRLAAWLAVFLMGVLTSWYYAVMIGLVNLIVGGVLAVGAICWAPAEGGRGPWPKRTLHLAAAAVVALVCVWSLARHYVGMAARPEEAAAYSVTPAMYVVPPENTMVGRWWERHIDGRPGSIYGETTVFAGWTAVALGLVGVGAMLVGRTPGSSVPSTRPGQGAWAFPLLALAGLLLSLGPSPPWLSPALAPFSWLTAVPGMSGMRAPARFALVAMLGLSGLASLGAQALVDRWRRAGTLGVVVLVPLMLAEWFVVDFPAGKPEVHGIPEIYRTVELQTARALASLPEYRDQVDWFRGGDYLYYSTAHWRPIVNGFGRSEPPAQPSVVAAVRAFATEPAAVSALGIQYVVVHADRLAREDRGLVDAALANPSCRLVRRVGSDYLFEIVP